MQGAMALAPPAAWQPAVHFFWRVSYPPRRCTMLINCRLRGFSTALYCQLQMTCTGMEFAVEMIIKASLLNARIGEVPVTLYKDKDGRKTRGSHLGIFRDGWRTFKKFWFYCWRGGKGQPGHFCLPVRSRRRNPHRSSLP
jgi:hypothetical protein